MKQWIGGIMTILYQINYLLVYRYKEALAVHHLAVHQLAVHQLTVHHQLAVHQLVVHHQIECRVVVVVKKKLGEDDYEGFCNIYKY